MIKETNTRVQLTLPKEWDLQLRELGDEMGIGRCGVIRFAIKLYLELDFLERAYSLQNTTRNKQYQEKNNIKK